MPVQITVADNAYQEKLITLGGNTLYLTFTFNTRNKRWYLDVADRNREDVITGIKILPSQDLSRAYIALTDLIVGSFFCIDTKESGKDITRDNFGTDKQFQLWYYTNDELEEIFNDASI